MKRTSCLLIVMLFTVAVLAAAQTRHGHNQENVNPAAPAQQTSQSDDMQALIAKNAEFVKYHKAGDEAAALKALDDMLPLARKAKRPDAVAVTLYNKACVLALTGQADAAVAAVRAAIASGFRDYLQMAGDSELDALRRRPDFISIAEDLRERYGYHPLEWDPGRGGADFATTFDAPDDPRLVAMRREFDIDSVVAGASDDYARLRALTAWTSRQWVHSSTNMASKGDPVTILREAKAGGRFICRDYAVVAAGVARAYGLPSRVLNLLPKDVETRSEAHSVAEVWLNQFGKWVLADGQYGSIAEIDGIPLNGVELQAAIAREDPRLKCSAGEARCAEWKAFIIPNLYFFKFARDQRRFDGALGPQLVLVPRGASEPHKFAGGNPEVFANSVYVSDPAVFYRKPW